MPHTYSIHKISTFFNSLCSMEVRIPALFPKRTKIPRASFPSALPEPNQFFIVSKQFCIDKCFMLML